MGARSSLSSELRENFSGRRAARPGTGARGAGAEAPAAPAPPPLRAARSLFWPLGSHSLSTPPLCREKGRGPRASLRLLGPLPMAGAPPQPARGPPAPPPPIFTPLPRSEQWLRRLDTPSPRPASRFLCQTKRDPWRARAGTEGAPPSPPREA